MPTSIESVIGFDLGTKWIGVAIGQTLTGQARPLTAIKAINQSPDWPAIEKLLQTWQPQKLVVGLPTTMLGEAQEMTARARRFSRQLEGRYHIATELVDERLTTREAYSLAIEAEHYHSKPEIDSLAAVLITESWLREFVQGSGELPEIREV